MTTKPFTLNFDVFSSCVTFWCLLYCMFTLLLDVITLSVYFGVIVASIVIVSYVSLWYISLPAPDKEIVTEVLGQNPKFMKRKNSNIFTTPINSGDDKTDEVLSNNEEFFPVFGHRGAGLDAPENSLAAIRQCHEKGCRAVEFDLALTADDVPVLFHDDTVDRITNSSGAIQHMTWEQLKALDISAKHPLQERFVGERIALFSETVKLCITLDMRMIIDIKEESNKIVQVILDTFKEHPKLYKRAMVSGFNPFIIYMLRSRDPNIVCSLAWRPQYYSRTNYGRDTVGTRRHTSLPAHLAACVADAVSGWLVINVAYYLLGLSAVLLHKDAITLEMMNYWEEKQIRVVAWTVNRPCEKLYFSRVLRIAYITDTLGTDAQ